MANLYAVVGQAWVADGTGTTDSTRRMVLGANNINITGAGNLTVTTASGATASAASDVATVVPSPTACAEGTDTVITVVGTGNIIITVTYASTANWSSHYTWATSSGGAPNSNGAEPTSPDNVFMDASSFTGASQVVTQDINPILFKDMDWTGAGNNPTFMGLNNGNIQSSGSVTFIAAMTLTDTNTYLVPEGTAVATLNTNGLTLPWHFYSNKSGGSFGLASNVTFTRDFFINAGVFNSNNYNITCAAFVFSNAGAKTGNLGSSVITCTSVNYSGSNMILAGLSTINCSGNFSGGGLTTYNIVNLTGATSTITGSNTFATLALPAATTQTITFTDGTTQTATNFNLSGDATHTHTLQGSAAAGWTLASPAKFLRLLKYVSVSNCTATNARLLANSTCTYGAGNVGWISKVNGVARANISKVMGVS